MAANHTIATTLSSLMMMTEDGLVSHWHRRRHHNKITGQSGNRKLRRRDGRTCKPIIRECSFWWEVCSTIKTVSYFWLSLAFLAKEIQQQPMELNNIYSTKNIKKKEAAGGAGRVAEAATTPNPAGMFSQQQLHLLAVRRRTRKCGRQQEWLSLGPAP